MRKLKGRPAEEAEVNMTPMLDIVFIMLIFFIVASTLERESGLDVTQKDNNDQANSAADVRAVYIQLCDNNSVFVDRRPVDIRSVRANVEAKLAAEPNSVVVIETQQKTSTGSLVRVMDQVIEARAPVSVSDQSAQCSTPV